MHAHLSERVVATYIIAAVAVAGATLRLAEYAQNQSLSLDESFIALNLLTRSPSGLLDQLAFNQGAPIGFLEGEKLAIAILGRSELALRALPLLSGLGALALFACLARRLLDNREAIVAVALFAASTGLILNAATAKQYSLDAAVACSLLLVADRILVSPDARISWAVMGLIGSAGLWISHPSVFILSGVAATLGAHCVARRMRRIDWLCVLIALWTLNFIAVFKLNLTTLEGVQKSLSGQSGSLATAAIEGSGTSVITFARAMMRALRDNFGVPQIPLADHDLGDAITLLFAVALIAGAVLMFRRARFRALLLLSPVIPFVTTAAIDKYPIFPRTLLFLLPCLIPLVAVSVAKALHHVVGKRHSFIAAIGLAVVTIVATPAFDLVDRFRDAQELKPVLRRLAAEQRDRDALYVFFATQYSLRYYRSCECLGSYDLATRVRKLWPAVPTDGPHQWSPALKSVPPFFYVGRRVTPERLSPELTRVIARRRTWILVSDLSDAEREALRKSLDARGRVIDSIGPFHRGSAAAYLVQRKASPQGGRASKGAQRNGE